MAPELHVNYPSPKANKYFSEVLPQENMLFQLLNTFMIKIIVTLGSWVILEYLDSIFKKKVCVRAKLHCQHDRRK